MSDQFFKTREETQAWLDMVGVRNYTIKDDLTVDVNDPVIIAGLNLTHIPVRFGAIIGTFDCSNNQLTSLKGAPRTANNLWCFDNRLTSLIGAPIGCRSINCENNQITGLEGSSVGCKNIFCDNNPDLIDISSAPEGCKIICDYNVISKNQSARQFADLETNDSEAELLGMPIKRGRTL